MYTDLERYIHSIKTAIACIVAFYLSKFIGLPADQWIVITVIVVMCAQIHVGGVMQKASLRLLGTLIGCLLATLTLLLIGDSNFAIISIIALSSLIFSYLATGSESFSYIGSLGAVTTTIIMLGQKPTIWFAGERFVEIGLGIVIATLVSQFFLPIHARTHLRRNQAVTFRQLRDYYTATDNSELDETIVKSLTQQRQLAKESAREPLGERFNSERFIQTLFHERDVLRAIAFMHTALQQIKITDPSFAELPAVQAFHHEVAQSFDAFIHIIDSGHHAKAPIPLPNITPLKQAIQQHSLYTNGFLFTAEILADTLSKLAELYQKGFSKLNTPEL